MTVDVADVAVALGRDLTVAESWRAGRLVEIAESLVEAEMPGFSFAASTETAQVAWHDPDILWTPRYPVTAVTSISVNGVGITAGYYRWDSKGKVELIDPAPWWVNGPILFGWPTVTVVYAFGLVPPPPVLAGVVAGMVAGVVRRQATNPGNVQAETIGSYQVTYGTPETVEMAVPELPGLWKRNRVASVPFTRSR